MTPLPGGFDLPYRALPAFKALLAATAFALLALDWYLGERAPARWTRMRNTALGAIGLLSIAAWFGFGAFHGANRPLHLHDFYHYYTGSKYFAELGYTRLYQCTAVADAQDGRARDVAARWTRNLHTNILERRLPTQAETQDCLSRFGPDRWDAFRADVAWFRGRMRAADWDGVPGVFGHNATPAWNAMGFWLANASPASDAQMLALAAFDPILIAALWTLLWRTFGWQGAAVGAIWWGLNETAGFHWIGGGFLRQDALFLLVMAVCALRTGRRGLAGAALGTAALLRAFPLFLLAGFGLKIAADAHTRGIRHALVEHRAFLAGAAGAALLILAFTAVTWHGRAGGTVEPWRAFTENSRKHLDTPVRSHLGLKPALWFDPGTRGAMMMGYWIDGPWDSWMAARRATLESRRPLSYAIVAGFVLLFWRFARRAEPWAVVAAGVLLLPFMTTLASYYYSTLLLVGLFWPRDRLVGVGLAALTALTAVLPPLLEQRDDRYTVISAALVVFAFVAVVRLARQPREAPAVPATSAAGTIS